MHGILDKIRLISQRKSHSPGIDSPRSDQCDSQSLSLRIIPQLKP
jgi:hypothetical protein